LQFIRAYSKAIGKIKITANPSGIIDGLRYYRAIKKVAGRFEIIKKILAAYFEKGNWSLELGNTFDFLGSRSS